MNTFTTIDNITLAKLQRKCSSTAIRVYIELRRFCYGQSNECYPSEETLAIRCHCNKRTIIRAIDELNKRGFIMVSKIPCSNGAYNYYTLNQFDKIKIKGYKKYQKGNY